MIRVAWPLLNCLHGDGRSIFPARGTRDESATLAMSATIFRDTYGVPHIVADSNAEAAFAVGYAQAEDRLEALLLSFRKALGRMAEISGPEFIDQDAEKILLQIPEMGKIGLASLSKAVREMLNAYVAGVERYTVSHPYRIPDGSHPPLPED
ncbi:MAG: hypothetical protein COZ56_10640, partial [Armatimonadetes bacterium CG_4_8_14_3_um_filter_58_9]